MDKALQMLEMRTDKIYEEILSPLARNYHLDLARPRRSAGGKPTILFLGNHSSGKSTFINYLLGDKLQKTGIAPTDDGFTIITNGSSVEESSGLTTSARKEMPISGLDRFGPAFLSRLRLKLVDNDMLKKVNLVDSPGMIDAANTSTERGYDFMAAVRTFAEAADLILFFFDPEKPGTTGETIAAFTESLSGLENKVLILMNKADMFADISDFARDYGSLCWNLSRVVQTKDMPHIYTTYVPQEQLRPTHGNVPLADFDESRKEIISEIERAPNRRMDNLINTLTEQVERLDMHIRICWEVKRHAMKANSLRGLLVVGLVAASAAGTIALRGVEDARIPFTVLGVGLVSAIVAWVGGGLMIRRNTAERIRELDQAFDTIYHRELTIAQRDDLRMRWRTMKERSVAVLQSLGLASIPGRGPRADRRYRKLRKLIDKDLARLRSGAV